MIPTLRPTREIALVTRLCLLDNLSGLSPWFEASQRQAARVMTLFQSIFQKKEWSKDPETRKDPPMRRDRADRNPDRLAHHVLAMGQTGAPE